MRARAKVNYREAYSSDDGSEDILTVSRKPVRQSTRPSARTLKQHADEPDLDACLNQKNVSRKVAEDREQSSSGLELDTGSDKDLQPQGLKQGTTRCADKKSLQRQADSAKTGSRATRSLRTRSAKSAQHITSLSSDEDAVTSPGPAKNSRAQRVKAKAACSKRLEHPMDAGDQPSNPDQQNDQESPDSCQQHISANLVNEIEQETALEQQQEQDQGPVSRGADKKRKGPDAELSEGQEHKSRKQQRAEQQQADEGSPSTDRNVADMSNDGGNRRKETRSRRRNTESSGSGSASDDDAMSEDEDIEVVKKQPSRATRAAQRANVAANGRKSGRALRATTAAQRSSKRKTYREESDNGSDDEFTGSESAASDSSNQSMEEDDDDDIVDNGRRATRQRTKAGNAKANGNRRRATTNSNSDDGTSSNDSDASNGDSGDQSDDDVQGGRGASNRIRGRKSSRSTSPGSDAPAKPARKVTKKRHDYTLVEKVLKYDEDKRQFLVKFKGQSYRRLEWVPQAQLEVVRLQLVRNFLAREETIEVDEDWVTVEKIIARRPAPTAKGKAGKAQGGSRGASPSAAWEYLVKWFGLEYSDCTWEHEDELRGEQEHIDRFLQWDTPGAAQRPNLSVLRDYENFQLPTFLNGRQLRSYQETAVRWMISNYLSKRSCILGDEMGLGKTAQSISVLECLRQLGGIAGPFLLVAPLTTLGHWQREIRTWTDMNVVVYSGSAADKDIIQKYEFYHSSSTGKRRGSGSIKFSALLVSYETLLREQGMFSRISFAAAVFDEAHKLKGVTSSTRAAAQALDVGWKLLLTGTPIQNNLTELWSILDVLDRNKYRSLEDFNEQYAGKPGEPPSLSQVQAVRELLAPVLLRRMKEDVETLPEKEEVIVWVELTQLQHQLYKAIYNREVGTLLDGGAAKNIKGLRNLAMELRKMCCHPFLCDGLEQEYTIRRAVAAAAAGQSLDHDEEAMLVKACGKMVLLDKLLPKLRSEGRKVLIFSQFTRMLDVLEDWLGHKNFPFERIDGSVMGKDRQAAIDRFSKGDNDKSFVFLLSTRAGGQGITLTAADTAIIYDSDWNPQNDLQAMARCHRIGQDKEVTVYRLVTKDTYEEHLFSTASRKYGLDEAILGGNSGEKNDGDPEQDAARLASLLAHGAHGLLGAEATAAVAAKADTFQGEDIEQILRGRTEKRTLGGRAGNTFSQAKFSAIDDSMFDATANPQPPDEDYWAKLMPEAVEAHKHKEEQRRRGPVVDGPRKRNKVSYRETGPETPAGKKRRTESPVITDGSESDGEGVSLHEEPGPDGDKVKKGKSSKRESGGGGGGARKWKTKEIKDLEEKLMQWGPGCWPTARRRSSHLMAHSLAEVCAVGRVLEKLLVTAPQLLNHALTHMAYVAPKPTETDEGLSAREAAARDRKARQAKEEEVKQEAILTALKILKVPEEAHAAMFSTEAIKRWTRNASKKAADLLALQRLHELVREADGNTLPPEVRDCKSPAAKSKEAGKDANGSKEEGGPSSTTPDWMIDRAAPARADVLAAIAAGVRGDSHAAVLPPGTKCVAPFMPNDSGMPLWWNKWCDEALLRGITLHGNAPDTSVVPEILADARLGFHDRVRVKVGMHIHEGAVELERLPDGTCRGTMIRSGHVASPWLWSPSPCDGPPPTPEAVQGFLRDPDNAPAVEAVLDVYAPLAPITNAGAGLGIDPTKVEVLIKFKGYNADLFTWIELQPAKALPNFNSAFAQRTTAFQSALEADQQQIASTGPVERLKPQRPQLLGVMKTEEGHTVQLMEQSQWLTFMSVMGKRKRQLLSIAGDEPAVAGRGIAPAAPPPRPTSVSVARKSPLPVTTHRGPGQPAHVIQISNSPVKQQPHPASASASPPALIVKTTPAVKALPPPVTVTHKTVLIAHAQRQGSQPPQQGTALRTVIPSPTKQPVAVVGPSASQQQQVMAVPKPGSSNVKSPVGVVATPVLIVSNPAAPQPFMSPTATGFISNSIKKQSAGQAKIDRYFATQPRKAKPATAASTPAGPASVTASPTPPAAGATPEPVAAQPPPEQSPASNEDVIELD